MPLFSVTLEGLEEVERDWTEARSALAFGLRTAVERAVEEGAQEAARTHRFQNRTGSAEANVVGQMIGDVAGGPTGEIVCNVPYASYLSNGHGTWQPDPFMGNAYLKAERVVVREVELAAVKAAKIMER